MSAHATGGAAGSSDPEAPELEGDLVVEEDDAEVDPFADEVEDAEQDLEEDLDEDLDDEGSDDEEAAEPGLDELAADDDGDEEDDEPAVTVVPPEAEFDDDAPVAVVEEEDDDEGEIEGLRDGEFVCRGCFMAKRETQLADADALLCRDCA